jgi:hypothetical protein
MSGTPRLEGRGLGELFSVLAEAVTRLYLTRPSQGDSGPYRATIAVSVEVRTSVCVVASVLLYNLRVNQVYKGEASALRKVPTGILVEAHITRASGGV